MTEKQGAVEAAANAAATATKFSYTTYTSAGVSVVSWWASIDWMAVLGVVVAVATFILNLYYKRKENQRADEIHQLRKKQYEQTKERIKGDFDEK
ncbi:holin [Acinetobacter courvalinii]